MQSGDAVMLVMAATRSGAAATRQNHVTRLHQNSSAGHLRLLFAVCSLNTAHPRESLLPAPLLPPPTPHSL